jgi:hypothetical protein
VNKQVTVLSVNGPASTRIEGAGPCGDNAVRCAYVGTNATLSGFTLAKGCTRSAGDADRERSGGGAWSEVSGILANCVLADNAAATNAGGCYRGTLNDCVLQGNSAPASGGGAYLATLNRCVVASNTAAFYGGGVARGTINNCLLRGNSALQGGGAYDSTLNNCTLVSNAASQAGGGASLGTLRNCIAWSNAAPFGVNWLAGSLSFSCTTPMPSGTGNLTNHPRFASAAAGNYRLGIDSPCIDRGAYPSTPGPRDLDGSARIVNWIVDMGAYEHQGVVNGDTDGDGIPNEWEATRGLNPAVSNTAAADADQDSFADREEYVADTAPLDPASYFPRTALGESRGDAISLMIDPSSTARVYEVYALTNLAAVPQTWVFHSSSQTRTGTAVLLTITNDASTRCYRTSVRLP